MLSYEPNMLNLSLYFKELRKKDNKDDLGSRVRKERHFILLKYKIARIETQFL